MIKIKNTIHAPQQWVKSCCEDTKKIFQATIFPAFFHIYNKISDDALFYHILLK